METFWKIFVISMIALATIITWSKQREDEEKLKEEEKDDEWEHIQKKIDEILDSDMGHLEKKQRCRIEMLHHGMMKYKEGFEMGQEIKLQEGLEMPEEVSKEIMKNQQNPAL